jgi:phosphate transport system substrate-binding protein
MRIHVLTTLAALLISLAPVTAASLVTVRGSPVVARAFSMGVDQLSKEHDIEINFVAEVNGLETIDRLGRDVIDIGLFTRKLTPAERAMHPDKRFTETLLGKQAVLVVVPDQVWRSGVRALTKEQFTAIYEREVKNWKQLGGDDREIVYYNREIGRGVWDMFMIFLYGDLRKAPLSKAEVLTSATDVRTTVEFNGGAVSIIEYSEVKDARVHALGIKMPDGTIIEPTRENIASGRYEMSRPLIMVTSKRPTGKVQDLLEFMIGSAGQECVKKAGHVPLAEMKTAE